MITDTTGYIVDDSGMYTPGKQFWANFINYITGKMYLVDGRDAIPGIDIIRAYFEEIGCEVIIVPNMARYCLEYKFKDEADFLFFKLKWS